MARRTIAPMSLSIALCALLLTVSPLPAADKPASDDPKIQAAIDRAIVSLRNTGRAGNAQSKSLVALALLKSGEPVDSAAVQQGIADIQSRVIDGKYTPHSHHYYVAGIEMMLLESADPETYRPELEAILKYILAGQLDNGSWYYPSGGGQGDTSITQYAMLGLWSAERAELEVPLSVWDRAANWHVKTQLDNGGFAYHPSMSGGASTGKRTMTAAAVGSLNIARMHLYPNRELATAKQNRKRKKSQSRKFRFLEPIDLDNPNRPGKSRKKKPKPAGDPTTPLSAIDGAIKRGIARLATNWSINNGGSYTHYYLYALERMTALADIHVIGEHDWYAEAAELLLQTQQGDGSWRGTHGAGVSTAFGLMCLGKATARMLNREERSVGVGAGLLAGGRGLPENLTQVQVTEGKVKSRKLQGPLDELLNELENPKSNKVESIQTAVLEKVQLGNREELIGQTDRLVRLARDPRAEVRRVALWALGHSGDVRFAPILIAAYQDSNVDVLVEARNALCTLSRKPRGFGLPSNPYAKLDEDATDGERNQVVAKWRTQLSLRWKQWYRTVQPYDERDGLTENNSQ